MDNKQSLDLEKVITKSGSEEYRKNCRRIEGEYYIINKNIFNINNRWYRLDSGLIILDHTTKKYYLKRDPFIKALHQGVVGFEKDEPIQGLFSNSPYTMCTVHTKYGKQDCYDFNIIPKEFFTEVFSTGEYYLIKQIKEKDAIKKGNNSQNAGHMYSIDDDTMLFNSLKTTYEKSPLRVIKEDLIVGKALSNYTYGFELEASVGHLPKYLQYKHGVYICRDGSLKKEDGTLGPEFVTVPMNGPKMVRNIKDLTKELNKRSSIGTECSYHLHIGNIRKDREFLVAIYKLGIKIQTELFSLFPFYKNDEVKYAGKEKNYAKKLKNIVVKKPVYSPIFNRDEYKAYVNSMYRLLFTFLLEGTPPSVYNNRTNKKHLRERKWERHSRYYWLNFMNMYFSERNTLEFRLHTPTLNSQKIISWVLLCSAIIEFTEKHSYDIVCDKYNKISLSQIMEYCYFEKSPRLYEYMNAYISHRKQLFKSDVDKGDFLSKDYILNDEKFKFEFHNFEKLLIE